MIFPLFSVRSLYNSKICPEEFSCSNLYTQCYSPNALCLQFVECMALFHKTFAKLFFSLVSSTQRVSVFFLNVLNLNCNDAFYGKYVNKEVF